MVTLGLLAIIGLLWMGAGIAMIAAPSWWTSWIMRAWPHHVWRFLLAQVALLGGLVLFLGTSEHQGVWIWRTIGVLGILKGIFVLGAPERLSTRKLRWWGGIPLWAHRLVGMLLVGLATFFMLDTLRR